MARFVNFRAHMELGFDRNDAGGCGFTISPGKVWCNCLCRKPKAGAPDIIGNVLSCDEACGAGAVDAVGNANVVELTSALSTAPIVGAARCRPRRRV